MENKIVNINDAGTIKDFTLKDNLITVNFENTELFITIIRDDIINFFIPCFRNERNSKAVENINSEEGCFTVNVEKLDHKLVIRTKLLTIDVNVNMKIDIYDVNGELLCADYRGEEEPFKRRYGDYDLAKEEGHDVKDEVEDKIKVVKSMEDNMFFYGFGEKTGHLNKKGYHYVNWNSDNPQPHGETFDRLYKSIPFFIGIKDKKSFGIFFDNHFETHFDMGRDNSKYYYFSAVDGNLDYYFIYGPEVRQVVDGYTYITGKTPLPQKWTLGYQQCRWSYGNYERVMEIAHSFRENDIPCDTIYLDIDYMDGYRVFTWDNKKFENPNEMIKELNNMGFKVVTIIDPGVKVDKGYNIYDEGLEHGYYATDKDGLVYTNEVWPGKSVYPDFLNSKTRAWWADNQKIMMDDGVSGIWNDMNEPASFKGPLPDDVIFDNDGIKVSHKEAHNVYGHFMAKATYEGIKRYTNKRPFIVTRACYAGTQKYSTVWTGDNQSTWEHLRMSLPMLMNLGLSGMAFCGTDVGGFGHDCSSELLSRWVQVGAFTPLFRNHSAMGTRDQEPWAFDKETEEINRKYIKLRYQLMPYIYDTMYNASKTGAPMIRPLLFNYQDDENTYEINDEFLCGNNILVAPVVEQGAKARMVYLPEGDSWIDYWTKEEFKGGQYIIRQTPLDTCPIYIKQGSIIPNYKVQNYVNEKINDKLIVQIFLGNEKTESLYEHYMDDGESFNYENGEYNIYKINVKEDNESINIEISIDHDGYNEKYKEMQFELFNLNSRIVFVNGKKSDCIDNKISFRF